MTLSTAPSDLRKQKQSSPKVVEKIKGRDGEIAYTMDTHDVNYLSTTEGNHDRTNMAMKARIK